MAQVFSVPKDGNIFVATIRDRCHELISSTIWSGISLTQFRTWFNAFTSPEESYFAACLADALIYRSTEQTKALMDQLLQRTLPDYCRHNGLLCGAEDDCWTDLKSTSTDPGIRLVPVVRTDESPAQSGPVIGRLFRDDLGIHEDRIIWPWQIEKVHAKGVHTLVFIDDFLGTGNQFKKFLKLPQLRAVLPKITAIYAPLAAHTSGIEHLKHQFRSLHVCTVEELDAKYSLFSTESKAFADGTNTPQSAQAFYHDLLRKRRIRIKQNIREGYGDLALTYAFEHKTPNNCIPLLWYTKNWNPLFTR